MFSGAESDVIPGVDAAVKTMKKDEISLIHCDSSYAFGDKGREEWGIEANMSVDYEIHLKSFEQVLIIIVYLERGRVDC